jgi:hypothetical protein
MNVLPLLPLLFFQAQGVELLPDFIASERVEIEGRELTLEMPFQEAMQALGAGAKQAKKPSRTSTDKLDSESRLVLRLAPWTAPMLDYMAKVNNACGSTCWMAIGERRLSKQTVVRAMFQGDSAQTMKVVSLVVDNGANRDRYLSQALADASENASYLVMGDQHYRISRFGRTLRVERLK